MNVLLNILIFLLSPIMSLIISLRSLNKKLSLYMVGLLFCFYGAYLPPTSDAYRYRMLYQSATSLDFNMFSEESKDSLFQIVSYFFNQLGLSFEVFKLFFLCVCYYLCIDMFCDILSRKGQISKRLYFVLAATLLFTIRVYTLSYGIRFGVATILAMYSIYSFVTSRYPRGVIFAFLAVLMHFAMAFMVAAMPLAYLCRSIKVSSARKILVAIVVGVAISFSLQSYMSMFLMAFDNSLLERSAELYTTGEWGTSEMLSRLSLNGLIFTVIRMLPLILIGYFVSKIKSNTFIINLFAVLLCMVCVFLSSLTFMLRFSFIAQFIGLIFLLQNIEYVKHRLMTFRAIMYSSIIVFMIYSYSQREDIMYGKCYLPFISPIYALFSDPYPDEWVDSMLRDDGLFINTTIQVD